ncbi:MAG: Asp/Glu racemase [Pseudomonadota bacterium]|nr:Asp/Glu racemase [Pseudomonadota bacterium]
MNSIPAKSRPWRVGMIVPSSNTTLESEILALLQRQGVADGSRFSLHAARLRLRHVAPAPEALRAMNDAAGDAVDALCDAQVDAVVYGCLLATMFGGKASVVETGQRLARRANYMRAAPVSVVTSADALTSALQSLGARSISMLTPYRKELTAKVAATIEELGIAVRQAVSLEIVDDAAVGRLDQQALLSMACEMDLANSDALVLSAGVQIPTLEVLDSVEQLLGLPVLSASTASVWALLQKLRIEPRINGAGWLLRSSCAQALLHVAASERRAA